MSASLEIPSAGQMVVVRNRPGVVRDVAPYGGNGRSGVLHLVDLEYIDGWDHPAHESVLWEREVGPRVVSRLALPRIDDPVSRPDAPERFAAYLDSIRWSSTARLVRGAGETPWLQGFALPEGSLELADVARERAEEPVTDDAEKDDREVDAARQGAAWLRLFGDRLTAARDAVGAALSRLGWTPDRMRDPFRPQAPAPPDAKWDAFRAWLDQRLRVNSKFRDDERVILFTEYKDTLAYLLWRVRGAGIDRPALRELYGGAPLDERELVKEAFNDPASPLRVLLATPPRRG
jgi:hypothetical protein